MNMPNVTIDLTQIIIALLGLLSALITYKLIPWIKANTTSKQQAIIRTAIQTAVFAAEQIYGTGNGEKKFQYVVDWLAEKGYEVDKAEIEAAVYEFMNNSGIVIEAPSLTAKVETVAVEQEDLDPQRQM